MKKYIGLIIILIIPLIWICAYSFYETDISIMKKANIASHFRPAPIIHQDTLDVIVADTVVCDTTKQRILFFGDSMLEGLGKRMKKYAGENGHELQCIIWYSSSSKVWGEHIDTLSHFIRKFQPTYIFACIGANELFVKDLDKRDQYVKTIVARIDTIPYIWIGPPNWKDDTGINDIILNNVGKYRFFPSKNLTYKRSSDGAHPTSASAAQWMDSVAVFISDSTKHRILMRMPQDDTQPKGETILLKPLK